MVISLSILLTIIFIFGCYYMGNKLLDTFDDHWTEQIMSSIYGIFCWAIILVIILLFFGIYHIMNQLILSL
jgi:uncharacterized BrkB/YihY/UPF0761 family membrane protein